MRWRLVLGFVLTLGCGACASAPPPCPVTPDPPPGPPALWRVTRAGGGPPLWLFGTIHDVGLDAVPAAALAALAAAPRFASELGDGEPDADGLRAWRRIEDGPGLDFLVPRDVWWDLRDALEDVIAEDELRRTRPWFALLLLNRQAAPAIVAMDVELTRAAHRARLPVVALETWEAQVAAMDAVVTAADLGPALHGRAALRCAYGDLRGAYIAGDLATLAPQLILARSAEPMLWARNRRWLPALEAFADGDGAFVAVGLGHLLGEHGLVALLLAAGYSVERSP